MITMIGILKLLFITYGIQASSLDAYNITKIEKGGIYFEHLGKINHYDSEWTLISYLDISVIHRKIDVIDKTYSKTKEICFHKKISNYSLCDTSFVVLNQIIPQLYNQENVLKELTGRINNVHRVKRSYIDGIGKMFKLLFGTLDVEDAERYDDAITNLDSHQHDILSLLKSQTNVIKSTISNFNNTLTDLSKDEQNFYKNLDVLSNYTQQINTILFDVNLKQDIDEHLSLLILITTEVNNEIATIINAILFAKNNALHPMIITPEQYLEELKKTVSHLPTQTKYPLSLSISEVSELLSLTNLVSYYMNDKLVFLIKTPLITQTNYELYYIMPVPIRNYDNTFVFILPKEKYFMISSNKLHYTYLEDLKHCKKLSRGYICKLNSPLYSVHGNPTCETELMFGNSKVPGECDTRLAYIINEQWYKMHNENDWLFVLPRKTIATLSCRNREPIDFNLMNTGILSITDSCKLYTIDVILQTEIKGLTSEHNSILPSLDLINDDCCKKIKDRNISKIEFIPLRSHDKLDLESLNIASHKIDKIDELISKLENESIYSKVTNNVYFVYIVMSILKIIACYLVYRIVRYIYKRKFFCTNIGRHLAIEDTRNCCSRITNCITLKVSNSRNDIELEEIPSTSSGNVESSLRRSSRIAQLKIN